MKATRSLNRKPTALAEVAGGASGGMVGLLQPRDVFAGPIDGSPQTNDGFAGPIDGSPQTNDGFAGPIDGFPKTNDGFAGSIDGSPQTNDGFAGSIDGFPKTNDGFAGSIDGFPKTNDGFARPIDGMARFVSRLLPWKWPRGPPEWFQKLDLVLGGISPLGRLGQGGQEQRLSLPFFERTPLPWR